MRTEGRVGPAGGRPGVGCRRVAAPRPAATVAAVGALLAAAGVAVVVAGGAGVAGAASGPTGRAAPGAAAAGAGLVAVPGTWHWPVDPHPVIRTFQAPADPYGRGHRGVDLAAAAGQPVATAGAGTVAFAGTVAGTPVVTVEHGSARTTYEPVRPSMAPGTPVLPGQEIGHLVAPWPHCPTVPGCLHWGLIIAGQYADPLVLVEPVAVRLLPHLGAAGPGWRAGAALRPPRAHQAGRGPAAGVPSPDVVPVAGRRGGRDATVAVRVGDAARAPPAGQARGCACSYTLRSRSADTWV